MSFLTTVLCFISLKHFCAQPQSDYPEIINSYFRVYQSGKPVMFNQSMLFSDTGEDLQRELPGSQKNMPEAIAINKNAQLNESNSADILLEQTMFDQTGLTLTFEENLSNVHYYHQIFLSPRDPKMAKAFDHYIFNDGSKNVTCYRVNPSRATDIIYQWQLDLESKAKNDNSLNPEPKEDEIINIYNPQVLSAYLMQMFKALNIEDFSLCDEPTPDL